MTEPTDAEIVALADATRTAEGGANGYILPISFCRAVLAKWGAPQPVACEPLTDSQAQTDTPCRKNPFYHGPRNCSRGTVGCCEDHGTATQAQAGAVPLTDEQIEALPMWKRFVGLWPETRREIVRIIESAHGIGIKGGQHGTE